MTKVFSICILLFISTGLSAQQFQYNYSCINNSSYTAMFSFPGPLHKPLVTGNSGDSSAYFRVLMVFVEFKDDESWDPGSQYWPPNSPPRYIDSLFSPVKLQGEYPQHIISDYYKAVTRGQFDIIGDVYHVILPYSYEYYKQNYGSGDSGRNAANLDVLKMLDTNLMIDWNRYDKWGYNNTFLRVPDRYIDMVYIQYRRGKPDFFELTSGGHADLMVTYNTLMHNKIVMEGTYYLSSGLYGINGSSEPKMIVLDFFVHEYGHYLLGDHRPYSRISGGDGSETQQGWERAFSPQDMISLGIANIIEADWTFQTYNLPDFISTGTVLKVPTTLVSHDYFLVCNRRRLVKYDCNTGGDTVMAEMFRPAGELDKGIYIYHVYDGNMYEAWYDLECADGLWDWSFAGLTTPDWSNTQLLPVMEKIRPGRLNDEPAAPFNSRRMFSTDGFSVVCNNCQEGSNHSKWFSPGKRHTYLGDPGLDRKYTNLRESWCSRECLGDRYDAWKTGYNRLFSPYSNPSTLSRSQRIGSDTTGVFIYIESDDNDTAKIKVYRKDLRGYSEAQILTVTPPARPVLYKAALINCIGNRTNPKITWDNNLEPDMLFPGNYKHYKIFRAVSTNPDIVPLDFTQIGTYNDHTPNDTSNYIDRTISFVCSGADLAGPVYCRYYITAVDAGNLESDPSEYVTVSGNTPGSEQNHPDNSSLTFRLYENYPNPFNPVTKIRFSIPQMGILDAERRQGVQLKIYDILGREIASLINEQLKPGIYEVTFDASNYPSGVYFYKLIADEYSVSKKMILIK